MQIKYVAFFWGYASIKKKKYKVLEIELSAYPAVQPSCLLCLASQ